MVIILHNIRSLHNVGSIFRTADAAGVEKIYCCGITPTPVDRFGKPRTQFTKVSLGAEKYVPWKKISNITALIKTLKKEGYKIFAVEQSKSSTPYNSLRLKTKSSKLKACLIVGNEVRGLPISVLRHADQILEVPVKGRKESLNVAVAFGIAAFHLLISD